MVFNVSLLYFGSDLELTVNGSSFNALSGNLYLLVQKDQSAYVHAEEVSFSSDLFSTSFLIEGCSFLLEVRNNGYCYFSFTPDVLGKTAVFEYNDSLISHFSNNGGDTSSGGFSVPSLNGNCASLPDGTTVNVTGLKGDFVVEGSQFTWNDSTAQMSMIIYKLSNAGKFCLVPDVYVTAKAS